MKKVGDYSNINIRKATVDDTAIILSFIKELAEYEKLSDKVVATEFDIQTTLFGAKPYAEVIIGEYNNKQVSFALFFHSYSTFLGKPGIYLEDLYVKPEYRNKGIGRKMLAHIAGIARQRNCGRFEWAVLDWNISAIKAYEKIKAAPISGWTTYRLDGKALDSLANEL